jgi:hypothetical protein
MAPDQLAHGLSPTDIASLWEAVKANNAKLDACARHRLSPPAGGVKLGEKQTCLHSGGEMRLADIGAYIRGRGR